jgi:hypothetical protein
LLGGEERHGGFMRQLCDELAAGSREQRGEVLGVALACAGREA